MKRILFAFFLLLSAQFLFAQERYGFVDMFNIIPNAQILEGKPLRSNRQINAIVIPYIEAHPDWINQRLSWYPDGSTELFESYSTLLETAAENGNDELIEYLISKGADINLEGQKPPLIAAAGANYSKTIKLLIDKYHADINVRMNVGLQTPLIEAASFFIMSYHDNKKEANLKNTITTLLEYPDIDVNAVDHTGQNAASYLFKSSYNGDYGCRECALMLKKLLQHGAKRDNTVNPLDPDIIKTIQHKKFRKLLMEDYDFKILFFKYLFDIDLADIEIAQEGLAEDFFAHLSDSDPQELINIIERITEIRGNITPDSPQSQEDQSPYTYFLSPYEIETVCTPITYEYDNNDPFAYFLYVVYNSNNSPDGMVDGRDGWVYMFQEIRRHPEYITMVKDNKTILTAAGSAGNVGVLQLINRTSGMPKDENGEVIHPAIDQEGTISPLIAAAQTGRGYRHLNPTNFLLRNGADVNAQHPDNLCTPLMYSIIYNHAVIAMKLLEQKGIDVNLTNSENKTALRYAFEKGCIFVSENDSSKSYDLCAALMDAGATLDDYLVYHPDFMQYKDIGPMSEIIKKLNNNFQNITSKP